MADTKITALTAITSFASGDLLACVDDPGGSPETKKATINQVSTYVGTDNLSNLDNAATAAGNLLSGTSLSSATVATGDKILGQDANDSDNLKTFTAQSIANLYTVTEGDVTAHEAAIDHDALTNFVANEHINWTSASDNFSTSGSVTVDAGGLVNTNVNINGSTHFTLRATAADTFVLRDATAGADRITVDSSGNVTFAADISAVDVTGTGVVDFGGATSVEIPSGTSVTTNAAGEIALDTDGNGTSITTGVLQVYDGTQNTYVVSATNYPTSDNDVPAYDSATNSVTWQAQSGAGGGISNVVEDTTPQLGGQLDVNGNAIGDGTLELLTFTEDASAVNHINIENEATGSGPILSSTGDDANVELNIDTKGTANINLNDNVDVTGNIAVSGTVDGRDLATDGTKLDGIETSADVTDATNVNAAGAVMESDYDANTILAATTDNTPATLTVGEQTLVGRITSGNIAALTPAQIRTLINVEDGATADQSTEEIQDIAGPLVATGGTKTGIAVTYQDATGDMDFVVDTASTSQSGIAELATIAETDTGTDTGRTITPDALAGSYAGTKEVQLQLAPTLSLVTGDGKIYFSVPSSLGGMDLVDVHAEVITAGTTGTTDIQIHNVTQTADMLSTKITIDSTETGSDTAATAAVIDTANDDVASYDVLRIDIDAVSTTAPKGLIVTMQFRLP